MDPEPKIQPQQSPTSPEAKELNQTPLPTKSHTHKKLWITLAIILGLILVGVAGYFLGKGQKDPGTTPPEISPTSMPTNPPIMPTTASASDVGIPINENTVSFTRVNDAVYLRYRGKIYSEEAANKNDPSLTNLPNPDKYTWYGLVDAPVIPSDLKAFDELFDFKTLSNKKNFVFIMRWPVDNTKTDYKLYLYDISANGNKVSLFHSSTQGPNSYTVPRIKQISSDDNYIALNMFSCWNCGGHAPETLLLSIKPNKTKFIGKVSYFNWKENGNYEFKEYKVIECNPPLEGPGECSEDPNNLSLQTGSL